MNFFRNVADIQTSDMLNLPVPKVIYENIIAEPSEIQKAMVHELSERAAAVHNKEVEPSEDNMLLITTDGRKIGLDARLMDPLMPDHEESKVNACAREVFKTRNNTRSERLTQLIFCDFSTPNKDGRFNVYDDIREKLIARGIPEHELAFIHEADTETKKKELFAKVRQGKVRVLFGSTFKMGTGTNVQDRLIELHDLDCPWRPSDLEQRAGRGIRQGTLNPEIRIKRYATNGTFDSYLWQAVQKKQEFIAQIMSSKSPVRSCEDCDETALSYAEIKALCAGNPLIAEKMNLDNEIAKLRMLKAEHKSQSYRLEDELISKLPQQIAATMARVAGIEIDMASYLAEKKKYVTEQTAGEDGTPVPAKFPGMTINGVFYEEKEPATKTLLEAYVKGTDLHEDVSLGEYMGFKMSLHHSGLERQFLLQGSLTYKVSLGTDALGNITRINNALENLSEHLESAKEMLENLKHEKEAIKEELAKPFGQEAELEEKEARLALLNADLNIDDLSRADSNGGMEILNDDQSGIEPRAYSAERVSAKASAKTKPSLLESIRNFDSAKYNGGSGRDKRERSI